MASKKKNTSTIENEEIKETEVIEEAKTEVVDAEVVEEKVEEKKDTKAIDEGLVSSSSDKKPTKKSWAPERITKLIQGIVVTILGILLCCSLAFDSTAIISYILGAGIIILGLVFLAISLISKKSLYTGEAVIGGLAISIGILVMWLHLFGVILDYIPIAVTVAGGILLLAPFIKYFVKNDTNKMIFVLLILLGTAVLALGICLLVINGFKEIAAVVLGALLILYGLFVVVLALLNKKIVLKKRVTK
jgi:sulfite exporter TauE/SafE